MVRKSDPASRDSTMKRSSPGPFRRGSEAFETGAILPSGRARQGSPIRRWIEAASWAYAASVLTTLALIRLIGERWWPVTLLVFMPRWLFLLPAFILAPAAVRARRKRLWALQVGSVLVVAGPLMTMSLPLGRLWSTRADGLRLRIMTLNRGLHQLDAGHLIRLIERERIELICFQEGFPNPVLRSYWKRKGWTQERG